MNPPLFRLHKSKVFAIQWLVLSILSLLLANCKQTPPHEPPPNIIVFLVDDLGWQDTSVPFWNKPTHFNKRYHTPNMERLAKEGMKFTQAYATSVCSPSRISLMTGMNAARHKVTNWTLHKNQKSDGVDSILQTPNWNMNGMNIEDGVENTVVVNTLPQLLQENGYKTIHVGKAHFAATNTPCANPLNCGFDINIAGHAAGAPGSYQGENNFGNNSDGTPKNRWSVPGLAKYHGQNINLTEVLTLEAKRVLDSISIEENPFFLYMAHYSVHTPIEADQRFFQKYLDNGLDTIEARYASLVEGMDKSLGDLMDYLEEKNLTENTAILFMSDNGGLSAVARGGERHTHNWPLSSGKGSAREGGIREPMLVKWPGVVDSGSTCIDYIIIEDFFPTILEIAELDQPTAAQVIDGQSFVPKLKQESFTSENRQLIWHYPNIWGPKGPGIGAYSAIRKGNWKLIYYHKDRTFELFDLENDIGEEKDLKEKQPTVKIDLAMNLSDFLRKVEAQMPFDKITGEVIPWPDELN